MPHDVFISYSSKDKQTADAVCAALESECIRCWTAPRDVTAGADWGESILDAIKGTRVMVLVLSANANESPHIRREVERAVSLTIPIIPLRVENVAPGSSLELFLSTAHWLDAFNPPLERHLRYLAQVIHRILRGPAQKSASEVEPARPVTAAINKEAVELSFQETPYPRVEVASTYANGQSRRGFFTSLLVVAVVGLIGMGWWLMHTRTASPIRKPEIWLPVDISAACNADIITTADRKASDALTFNGGNLATSSWLQKNGYSERGILDDGRVAIPGTGDNNFFQLKMPPHKGAILLSGPEGSHPQSVTVEMSANNRQHVSSVSFLHVTEWAGFALLRVSLHYETGAETESSLKLFDCWHGSRPVQLPPDVQIATVTIDIRAARGMSCELLAQNISADAKRVLRSITFSFDSIKMPPIGVQEQTSRKRFITAIFAISVQPAE